MEEQRGRFIVFDGIDGCGKTTQWHLLGKFILEKNKYNHVLMTREPFKSREIREILKQKEDAYSRAFELTRLFFKDRKEQVEKAIIPNIEKGFFVLSDRYKYSTICYQGAQGISIDKLIELHKQMPIPDIVFIFDVPVEVARQRMEQENIKIRGKETKFEKSLEFQEKVRQNFLKMPRFLPNENIHIINGNLSKEEIFEQIKSLCLRIL